MKNGRLEILAIGDRFAAAFTSLEHALPQLGDVSFKQEKSFDKAIDAVDFVRNSSYDAAIMPNPYGNEKRLWIYRHLKQVGFPVIVFDRGALPRSWFFDVGFNADSASYDPQVWDKPLSQEVQDEVRRYIEQVKQELVPLEAQGERVPGAVLKQQLGLVGKKVLLVAFQRPSDTTIKYFAGAIGSYEAFCELVTKTNAMLRESGSDWVMVAKKHPLETSRPEADVDFVSDDTNINSLIEIADMVLVVNSGVGLLASLWGKPVLHSGDAFYSHPGINRLVNKPHQIVYYLTHPFAIDTVVRDRFVAHLTQHIYSFAEFKTELARQKDGSLRNITREIEFETLRWPQVIKKKRCLYLSSVLPIPVNRGNAQRTDQTLRALLDLGYKVDLLLLNQSEAQSTSEHIRKRTLAHYKSIDLNVTVRKHPKIEVSKGKQKKWSKYIRSSVQWMKKQVSEVMYEDALINGSDALPVNYKSLIQKKVNDSYDFAWVNYARLYTPLLEACPVIVDLHDLQKDRIMVDVLPKLEPGRRQKYLSVFERSEKQVMTAADLCVSISALESEKISSDYCPSAQVFTISATAEPRFLEHENRSLDLLFVGSNSDPNVDGLLWFLDEVWPLILESISPKLKIVGAINRNKKVIAALSVASRRDLISTEIFVEDLAPVYQSAEVVLCPIRYGTGMKIKVVEALSFGKPIVATVAALEGISLTDGLVPALNEVDFANQVILALTSDEIRAGQRQIAMTTFHQGHSKEYLMRQVDGAVQKVLHAIPRG